MSVEMRDAIKNVMDLLVRDYGWSFDDEALQNTPSRVERMLAEFRSKGQEWKFTTFENVAVYDGIVILRGIPFMAFCEHHLLPFWGTVDIAYLVGDRLSGISKLARTVDAVSYRSTTQEKMTGQIADAVSGQLNATAVFVRVQGQHGCMIWRGVSKVGSTMVTSAIRGKMNDYIKNEMIRLL